MNGDLTKGSVMKSMLLFAVPLILGHLLQQCYNIADTWIVGKYLGPNPLAAVGSAFTLMTFLTSIILGLCMGSGAYFSICFGQKDQKSMKEGMCASFVMIALLTVVLNILVYVFIEEIGVFLNVPPEVWGDMKAYLSVIFLGIAATFFYNFFASLLRAVGNSVVPLIFLAFSAVLNIALDLVFILVLERGVAGAAEATVISQYISGIGLAIFTWWRFPALRIGREHLRVKFHHIRTIMNFSGLTCLQQSVMNLGILMVQGRVNSFGPAVMTAFTAAVKIDAFAYMPVQDFANAFSTFIAQNFGAKQDERIQKGFKGAVLASLAFCLFVSAVVFIFAENLMMIFIEKEETSIIAEGVRYLRIEGAFYFGIGFLFLLYGLYRALGKPVMSLILTVISLGTRVALAYLLSAIPEIGVVGIWWSVPIGWMLADITGFAVWFLMQKHLAKRGKM